MANLEQAPADCTAAGGMRRQRIWPVFAQSVAHADLVFAAGMNDAEIPVDKAPEIKAFAGHDQNRNHRPLVLYAAPIGAAD